jgi:spore maturation protein CgeB
VTFDRHVLLAVPQWDYADAARGPSMESQIWIPAMRRLVRTLDVLPFDGAMNTHHSLDSDLLSMAERIQPDLVLFSAHGFGSQAAHESFQGEVSPHALLKLRGLTTTAAFFWDDHWRFDDFSSHFAALYDFVITTEPTAVPRYRALGGHPVLTEYAGVVHPNARPPVDRETEFRYDVSFVGGIHPWRKWLVEWLGRRGVEVACFGEGWPNGRVGFDEMDEVFRTSRINLNISNSRQHDTRYLLAEYANFASSRTTTKTTEQIKARHFEIPIAGGCQLSYYVPGIEAHLAIGEELAIYTTPEDCLSQIECLLANPDRRLAMTRRSWERCRSEHTYDRRFTDWFAAVWPEDVAAGNVGAPRRSRARA